MIQQTRNYIIYLLMLFILTYVGIIFSVDIVQNDKTLFFNHYASLIIILLNSGIIYWISFEYSKKLIISFFISALYITSPFHFNSFLSSAETQFLLAETGLLLAVVFYIKRSFNRSLIMLILAIFFNFKMLGITIPILFSKEFSRKQKAFLVLNSIVTLVYIYPTFFRRNYFQMENLKTLVYLTENLFTPFHLSFVNYAIVVPQYYTYNLLYFSVFLISIFSYIYYYKKYPFRGIVSTLIVSSIVSIFIPVKYILNASIPLYFLNPEIYPFILFLFLIFSMIIFTKYYGKKMNLILGLIVILWVVSTISLQQNSRSNLIAWTQALSPLPEAYKYEDMIKFQYTNMLISEGYVSEAEQVINESKKKFLNDKWFTLHLKIATERKDEKLAKQIHEELIRYKVPYELKENP